MTDNRPDEKGVGELPQPDLRACRRWTAPARLQSAFVGIQSIATITSEALMTA
jgi:hypothetical protein